MTDNKKRTIAVLFYSLFGGYAIVEKLLNAELTISLWATLAFITVIYLFYRFINEIKELKLSDRLFCCLFAIISVVCESFHLSGSFDHLFGNVFYDELAVQLFSDSETVVALLRGKIGTLITIAAAFARTVGFYCIALLIIAVQKMAYSKVKDAKYLVQLSDFLFNKKSFLKIFTIIFVLWLPYLIIKFPGSVSADSTWQIRQFFGETEYTTHHPVFSTWIIGGFIWLGSKIINFKFGIFLCALVQYTVMAGAFAYSIVEISKLNDNKTYPMVLVVGYAIAPCFGNTASSIVKDAFFCSLFTLFIVKLCTFVKEFKENNVTFSSCFVLFVLGILVSLFRNNGIYAVAPTLIIVALMILFKKGINLKVLKSAVVVLVIVVFCCFNLLQTTVLNVKKGSIAEALSIPFQQTARYVTEYGNEVTEEERQAIDAVLDYDNLAADYNPYVSDPVKAKYKGDNSALVPYLKVWFKQFLKHPGCYFEATINQNYPAFYLDISNIRNYKPFTDGTTEDYAQVSSFGTLRTALLGYSTVFSLIPVVSQIVNPVLYVWIMIYMIFYAISHKKRLFYVVLVPLFLSLLVVIAGPTVMNNARYLYPISWSIPFVIPYLYNKHDDCNNIHDGLR